MRKGEGAAEVKARAMVRNVNWLKDDKLNLTYEDTFLCEDALHIASLHICQYLNQISPRLNLCSSALLIELEMIMEK